MTKKSYPIISLEGFLYLVDNELWPENGQHSIFRDTLVKKATGDDVYEGVYILPTVIASNNPSLTNIPILPSVESGDLEKLSTEAIERKFEEYYGDKEEAYRQTIETKILKELYEEGWKAAKVQGTYTEKQLEEAFDCYPQNSTFADFLKFLNKQPIPIACDVEIVELARNILYEIGDSSSPQVTIKPKTDSKNNLVITKYIYE